MNYIILRGQHGQYGEGSVLPRFVFEEAGGANAQARAAVVAEMVERGQIAPSDLPVNRDIAKPVARGVAADPAADLKAELDRLRAANKDIASDRDAHKARADMATVSHAAMKDEIATYVVANNELKTRCEHHKARAAESEEVVAAQARELADLKAQIDTLTAPPKSSRKATAAA